MRNKHATREAKIKRIQELAQVNKTKKSLSENRNLGTLIDVKRASDGLAYGIVKESHHYFIKKAGLKENLDISDFTYIGGLANKTDFQYNKLSEADKVRNMLLQTINESNVKFNKTGKKMVINEEKIKEDDVEDTIEKAEEKMDDLDTATEKEVEAEPVVDDIPDLDDVGGEDLPAPEMDAGEEMPEPDAGEEVPEMPGEEMPGEEMPEPDAGEETPAADIDVDDLADPTKEIESKLGKIANQIRNVDLTPSQVKSYVNTFLAAFKDDMPEVEIEDRKEMANKILKVVDDEDIEAAMDGVEDEVALDENVNRGSFSVEGTYGHKTPQPATIYVCDGWYAVEGSMNVNKTHQPIEDGVHVEDLNDVDTFTTSKPINSLEDLEKHIHDDLSEGKEKCSECGDFVGYVESLGYDKETIKECGTEEMANIISGYANAHADGMNEGDFDNVALFTNEEVSNMLREEYGHEDYVQKLDECRTKLNESTDEEIHQKIDELSWGGLKRAGKFIGDKAKEKVGGAVRGIGDALKSQYEKVSSSISDFADEVKQNYNKEVKNDILKKLEKMSADLGTAIGELNAASVAAGDGEINVGSILTTMKNQITRHGKADLTAQRSEGVVDAGYVEVKPEMNEEDVPEIEDEPKPEIAPDADVLGVGLPKPDSAGVDVQVDGENKTVSVSMNEGEQKIRKYVRARLEEKMGLRKSTLNESKKSPALKKLDTLIDKKFKLYEGVVKKKGKVNEEFDTRPAVDDDFIEIETPINSSDDQLFTKVVNMGIDSHLEGFTKSKFGVRNYESIGKRAYFNFHKSEKPILLRRLQELYDESGDENILSWIDNIENYDGLNESEQKLRKYVRNRLMEITGQKKSVINESKKSPALKKLDEVIDKQFKLYNTINVNENIFDRMFGYNWQGVKKAFERIDDITDRSQVEKVFIMAFEDSLKVGAIRLAARQTNTDKLVELIRKFIEHKGGALRLDANKELVFVDRAAADKIAAKSSDFAAGGTRGVFAHGGV